MSKISLIYVLMLFSLCLEAQILIVPKEKLLETSNQRLSEYASYLKFDKTYIKADPMSEDDGESLFTYSFENVGPDTLTITRLVSTCSCMSVVSHKKIIAPGDTTSIKLTYNPKGHPGRFERRAFVYISDDKVPTAVLRLAVDVDRGKDLSGQYPLSMGNIRLRRTEASFTKGVKGVERFVLVNVSESPLALDVEKAMLPPCLTFRCEPDVLQPGQEGEIVIGYDPSKGEGREKMFIMLSGTGVPPSQSSIIVTLK